MTVIATDTARASNLIKHEHWPETGYCRKSVTAFEATAKTYAVGTVLGKVIADGTATSAADAGNTGDGVMGAVTVTAGAVVGKYRLVITTVAANAGTFVVIDPTGRMLGAGTVAVAYSDSGIAFTLADGAADFVVGDAFTILVAGAYEYKIAVQTATDGTAVAAAVVIEDKAVPATTDTAVLVLEKGPAEISKDALVLDASYDTAAEKQVVYDALEALGINVLVTV